MVLLKSQGTAAPLQAFQELSWGGSVLSPGSKGPCALEENMAEIGQSL